MRSTKQWVGKTLEPILVGVGHEISALTAPATTFQVLDALLARSEPVVSLARAEDVLDEFDLLDTEVHYASALEGEE
jgi:hypothetical protein